MGFLAIGFLLLFLPLTSQAADFSDQSHDLSVNELPNKKDETFRNVLVQLSLKDGWKAYAIEDKESGVPFTVTATYQSPEGDEEVIIFKPEYAVSTEKILNQSYSYKVYRDEDEISIPIKLTKETSGDIKLTITYSSCKNICLYHNRTIELGRTPMSKAPDDQNILNLIKKFYHSSSNSPEYRVINVAQHTYKDEANTSAKRGNINTNSPSHWLHLIKLFLIALIGGFILNFMPCVIPVLVIKLNSILKLHNISKETGHAALKKSMLFSAIGIVSFFAFLAILVVTMRSFGTNINWGQQFQSSWVISLLLLIVAFMSSSLLGTFSITSIGILSKFVNFLDKKAGKDNSGFISSFCNGLLVAIMSTPCSAPILGLAVSYSLSRTSLFAALLIVVIGLGLALPYLLVSCSHKFAHFIITHKHKLQNTKIKTITSSLLLATLFWLTYVLGGQIGMLWAILTLFACFMLVGQHKYCLAKWKNTSDSTKKIVSTALILFVLFVPAIIQKNYKEQTEWNDKIWQKFDDKKIPELVAQGKIVFVDITANWCLNCKMNKLLVLNSSAVKKILENKNIVAMRGDLTNPDRELTMYLQRNNRYGIPFNAIYSRSYPYPNPYILNEVLAKQKLVSVLEEEVNKTNHL